jgi:hypothetical protein
VGDTDGDGMPDWWEILYGLNPAVSNPPSSNADGDPFPDLQEYIADTNPTNPASFLQAVQVYRPGTQRVQVIFAPASTGRVYDIRWSTNMPAGLWTPLILGMPGTGSNLVIAVTNDTRHSAVRGEVRLP